MSHSKTLKLLLVEDNLADEQLLSEAFIEIEENRQWCNWHSSSIIHVEELGDALMCLQRDRFDAVLLNLSLPDSPALLETFLRVIDCACDAPVIVLLDEEDENLAHLLLREGAQEIVLKPQIECATLARSVRYAIERQRRATVPGFLALARHYLDFSRLSRVPLLLASIEIPKLMSREAQDLLLVKAVDVLNASFEPPALIGRLGCTRFGLIMAGLTETTLEVLLQRAALAIDGESGGEQVYFTVTPIGPTTNLEDLIAGETRQRVLSQFAS